MYNLLLGTDPTENTDFFCQEFVFIGPVPISGCSSIVERVCYGDVFTETLTSNGHIHMSHCVSFLGPLLFTQC
jgi:hypothetical protein